MSDTTTPQPDDTNAQLLRYLLQGPQQSYAPPAPVNRSIISLLGEAVGGGASDVAPADREAAGTRALLNFGANLSAASGPSVMPRNFGQILAQGVSGAEQSLGSSAAVSAARLGAQQAYEEKQQELQLEKLKTAIPLLQMLQTQQVQKGLLGGGDKPGTSIAAAGSDGSYEGDVGTLEGTGKSATSTAAGTGQFLEPVWKGFVAANPDLFKGMTPEQILAARNTPEIANKAITWLAQQNAPVLAKAGVTPSGPSLALAHRLGPAAAAAVMQAPENAPVADVLVASIGKDQAAAYIKANPDLGTATAGALRQKYAGVHAPGFLAQPAASSAPGAPSSAPTATAPPAAPAGPPAVSPPTVATGGEAAGPGGLATRNARMTTVSPAAAGDANAIVAGMIRSGADPTTLAPPGTPPAPVQTAGPGAPTDVQAQTKGLVVPPGVTPPPGVTATPQPPAPARVPDVFTPQPVTLPDYIQNRIDHPEAAPEIADSYRKELTTAVGPDAGKLMQQAVTNRATAIAKVKADATTEAAAYRKDAQAQQMEQWKVLRGEQQANDAATLAHTRSLETEMLKNREAQINSQAAKRDEANQKLLEPYQNGAVQAQSILPNIDLARQVLPMLPEDPSPWLQKSENRDKIASFEKYLPKNWQQSLKGADLFSQIMSGMVSEMGANLVSGQPGGRESAYEQFRTMLPSLAQSQSGRELALTFIQELAQRRIAEHEFMQNYSWDPKNRDPELHVANMGGALTAMNKPGALPPMLKLPPVNFDPTIPANSPKAVENGKLYVKYYNSVQDGGRYITYTKDGHPIARTKVAGQPPEMGED